MNDPEAEPRGILLIKKMFQSKNLINFNECKYLVHFFQFNFEQVQFEKSY
jgi:hypothetical protein